MTVRTRGWLLRKVLFRESDAMLTLFTQDLGKVSALARGAQRSRKRFAGTLEPMHTLELELNPRRDGFDLAGAGLGTIRLQLTQDLQRLEAAGTAFGWLRKAATEGQPEPLVWQLTEQLLDQLDQRGTVDAEQALAAAGLSLLSAWGWGLELQACVRCGKPCPPHKPAWVDASQGGVVCSACGGARTRIDAAQRLRLASAAQGSAEALQAEDTGLAIKLVESALAAHADIR
jgi:DNA repair protein RecO (recombination protein O)